MTILTIVDCRICAVCRLCSHASPFQHAAEQNRKASLLPNSVHDRMGMLFPRCLKLTVKLTETGYSVRLHRSCP
jgi:hypothetical protein